MRPVIVLLPVVGIGGLMGGDTTATLVGLSGTGVLALVFLLLMRGDLVTRRSHEAVVVRCSEELAKAEQRADDWRDIAMEALELSEATARRTR